MSITCNSGFRCSLTPHNDLCFVWQVCIMSWLQHISSGHKMINFHLQVSLPFTKIWPYLRQAVSYENLSRDVSFKGESISGDQCICLTDNYLNNLQFLKASQLRKIHYLNPEFAFEQNMSRTQHLIQHRPSWPLISHKIGHCGNWKSECSRQCWWNIVRNRIFNCNCHKCSLLKNDFFFTGI